MLSSTELGQVLEDSASQNTALTDLTWSFHGTVIYQSLVGFPALEIHTANEF